MKKSKERFSVSL